MTARPPRLARRRIAILGGGLAGLTAAYELSRTPELRARYEVTVYEATGRLGGKLASGRNPDEGWRNEEHGLHVWFGFYQNAFALTEEVLRRWRRPEGCRLRGLDDLLVPHHVAMHAERNGDGHRIHRFHLPRTGGCPGNGRVVPGAVAGLRALADLVRVVPTNLLDVAGIDASERLPRLPRRLVERLWPSRRRPGRLHQRLDRAADAVADALAASDPATRHRLTRRADRVLRRLQRAVARLVARAREGSGWLQAVTGIDLAIATARGLLDPAHGFLVDGDLDRLNRWELSDWLRHHGAQPRSVARNLLLAGGYDGFFQYAEGDRSRPSFEAGTGIRIILRTLLGYDGAIAWRITTGMGEGLIAPLYEVLRDQGVRFEFFCRLDDLELDGSQVSALHLTRTARGTYDPLVPYRSLRVWLHEPDLSGLEQVEEPVELRHGPHFDEVVLAVPLGVLRAGAARSWVDATPHIRSAVDGINLQASAAAQLWVDGPMSAAGWRTPASVLCWPAPFSIFCDMSQVIADEGWAEPPVASIYLCGVWRFDEARDPDEEARAHLDAMLAAHGHELYGEARVTSVFCQANAAPTDLCDSAAPNTAHLRPEAHESGADNLALASTWVRTGINATCVEAAVMSGMAAARALGVSGRPIAGEDFLARPTSKAVLPSVLKVWS